MHDSVLRFVRENLKPEEVEGKRVLEIGSRNINGSVREIIMPMKPAEYRGIDLQPGPGVDVVADWTDFGDLLSYFESLYLHKWDLVISTEMLEHARRWEIAVQRMKSAMKFSDGRLLVTTRSPGFPLHDEPDYWRFTLEHFRLIFDDVYIESLISDPQVPGVFLKARRDAVTEFSKYWERDDIKPIPMWR
jgi:hypothetical protein